MSTSSPDRPAVDPAEANAQAWALAGAWGTGDRMTEVEALMWRSERHPRRSATISVLMMLDTAPDWDRLRAAHDWVTRLVPRTRKRVLEPAVPVGPPAWVTDPAFDLDYHLRRVSLPGPGGMAQVLAFAQAAAMTPFDRTRPLWEGTLIEGLPDGRAAYFLKLHHSLTDGPGGVRLVSLIQSRHREHTHDKPVAPPRPSEPRPDPRWLAVEEVTEQVLTLPSAAGRLLAAGARVLAHPESAAASALRFAGSLRRTTAPWSVPGSPLFRGRTGKAWRFGVLECPLADLRAAAEAAGGSLNDAFAAALLGGMRRYHERHGAELAEMSMTMPVSLHKSDDPMGGHEWAGATFAAPVGLADPEERIATLRGIGLTLRVEPALDGLSVVVPVLNRVPSAVRAAVGRLPTAADLSASTFPGAPGETYLAGAKVERAYPFGPLPGAAVMAAMVSQAGTCGLGLTIDGSVVSDPQVLVECVREGLKEVLALAPDVAGA
ncbi:wax ester/triacylglycerol synthase domain-containing protein [Actinoplanes nipponensis]|uniref:diacylglycerol O-acyltransferase n=1 Tax=Actinoplanes nipponensis TaxID=135950 RepID=A0A919JR05_9ACTN|nr:wax ester/triacylglycerol synthase domain-containing protein [Actinoplanes nipponensis]GIE53716.1 diacylglycerol O-acyltransferase [Actinoplanes nipponensis]